MRNRGDSIGVNDCTCMWSDEVVHVSGAMDEVEYLGSTWYRYTESPGCPVHYGL